MPSESLYNPMDRQTSASLILDSISVLIQILNLLILLEQIYACVIILVCIVTGLEISIDIHNLKTAVYIYTAYKRNSIFIAVVLTVQWKVEYFLAFWLLLRQAHRFHLLILYQS